MLAVAEHSSSTTGGGVPGGHEKSLDPHCKEPGSELGLPSLGRYSELMRPMLAREPPATEP